MDISHLSSEIESLRIARLNVAKWKEVEEAMAQRIKEELGDAEEGTINGHVVVTWKQSKPGVTLDVKKMQEQLPPALLDAFRMEKAAARPFKPVDF